MPMTGIIFDIKKFAIHDGPGIRTTVFFKGCPLDCRWCHNPEARYPEPEMIVLRYSDKRPGSYRRYGEKISVEELFAAIEKDRIFYDQSGGGVTFSGGEPLLQPDFLKSVLSLCHENGIHTAVDTCGFAEWKQFEEIIPLTDLFLYDIKIVDDRQHIAYTGQSNSLIIDNLKRLDKAGAKIIIRIPMIPEVTDTDDNLTSIAEFARHLAGVEEISLLTYNLMAEDKRNRFGIANSLGQLNRQTPEVMLAKQNVIESMGFSVNIEG